MRRLMRSVTLRPNVRHAVIRNNLGNKNHVESAKQALLQFNIMTKQGIQPDVGMYTSLISTMGRARMEWQAYKLFARLLEQGLTPLPETYEALRQATDPSRKKLIEDIQQTVSESIEKLPEMIYELQTAAERNTANASTELFERYQEGKLPAPAAPVSLPTDDAEQTKTSSSGRMVIPGLRGTWEAQKLMQEQAETKAGRVPDEDKPELAKQLSVLHKEELRIFLTTRRQMRHGSKEQLVDRILEAVPLKAIAEMLRRRKKYFTAVGDELLAQLDQSKAESTETGVVPADGLAIAGDSDEVAMTAQERHATSPDTVATPWGVLRKPLRAPANTPMVNELRDNPLSQVELEKMSGLIALGDVDRIPERDLRRYARMHQLRWKRYVPGSLQESVEWHMTHFGPLGDGSPAPTPSIVARRRDEEALKATLEEHNALQVVASRAKHVQIVDSHEAQIRALRSSRQHAKESEIVEQTRRRMRNLRQAAELRSRVRSYSPMGGEMEAPVQRGGELPPWAVRLGDGKFDLKSGEFGSHEDQRITEKGMGNFVSEERRRKQYSVDTGFLPSDVRSNAEAHLANDAAISEAKLAERETKEKYPEFRRSRAFFDKHKAAKKANRAKESDDEEDDHVGGDKRLSSVLRWRPQRK